MLTGSYRQSPNTTNSAESAKYGLLTGRALSTNPTADDGIKVTTTYRMGTGPRVITSTPYRSVSDQRLEWTCTQRDRLRPGDCGGHVQRFNGTDGLPGDGNRTANTTTAYDSDRTR